MSIGIGSGLTNCFYQGCVSLNFDDIMCKHNMLFCKLCNLSIDREQLQHILWKHLVVDYLIYQPLPSDYLDQFEDSLNVNGYCMDAGTCILQPDLLSPIIQSTIKFVEEWRASGQ